jgi:cytidylate kinase/transcriptional regulator with XRE-family HTH domain/Zn-dependent peptidase ImmA (M78 family)
MIKNERQFRITKAQAEKFRATLKALESAPPDESVHPLLRKAELDALRSQFADLDREIAAYERLRSGEQTLVKVEHFEELPRALIQARIAGGLTQEQLAAKLKLKPQQIQRYEATDYQSASLARVAEIVRLLGVRVAKDVLSARADTSIPTLVHRLSEVGLQRDFVFRRLLPKPSASLTGDTEDTASSEVALEAAEAVNRIYGWSPAVLFGTAALPLEGSASSIARFKLPARVRKAGLGAYVVYAHYVALLVLEATTHLAPKSLPRDPGEVRRQILAKYGELTFEAALKYVWALGVPVVPLNDPGTFNGACWRVKGRNVIVLKQRTRSAARWLHDLLHEYFHAAHNPDLEEHPVIEESEMAESRRKSPEELEADQFAGNIVLNGRAEELVELCVQTAGGRVERLKSAVPQVAKRSGVPVEALANYMAFRLSLQGINWWGTATNLQEDGVASMCSPRDLLLSCVRLAQLNPIDRDLLLRASEPLVLAFSGKIGSGKTTLSQQVADALGWRRASFGEYLSMFAKSQGLDDSREVLQELGESLVSRNPDDFCRSVLAHFGWRSGEPLVIDGVRHATIFEALRRIVAPLDLRLVFVNVDEDTRLKRLKKTDRDVIGRLQEVEAHSTERDVVNTLPSLASRHIRGDRPPNEVVREIVGWVHQGDGVEDACNV